MNKLLPGVVVCLHGELEKVPVIVENSDTNNTNANDENANYGIALGDRDSPTSQASSGHRRPRSFVRQTTGTVVSVAHPGFLSNKNADMPGMHSTFRAILSES